MKITYKGVNYAVKFLPRKFWWNIATPPYHNGRGPYVTIGLWFVAIYRGY